jgi:hypothetical protein
MAKDRTRERWELAAAKLVDEVRWLLKYREAIVDALDEAPGRDKADARLREIHALMVALEIELEHAATSHDRTAIGQIAKLLKKNAGAVGLTLVTTATVLVTTDMYEAVTAVDTQSDRVIECVIEAEKQVDAGDHTPAPSDVIDGGDGATVPSEVTAQPGEFKLEPVPAQPVTADSGGEPRRAVELEGVADFGSVDMSGDLTVNQASDEASAAAGVGTIDARSEVHPPGVAHAGTAVGIGEAFPITSRRGSDDTDQATDDDADGPSSFTGGFSEGF